MAQQNDTFQLTCADSTVAEVKGGLVSQEQVDIIYDEQHAHFLKSIRNLKETGIFAECVDNNKDIQAKQLYLHLGYIDAIQLEEKLSKYKQIKSSSFKGLNEEDFQTKTSEEVLVDLHKLAKKCCMPEFSLQNTTQSKKQIFEAFLNQFD